MRKEPAPGEGQKRPKILFVCIGNTCRSPMAEGLFRKMAGDRFEVASAGVDGYWETAQPSTVLTLREKGIDMSSHRCRHIREFSTDQLEAVFTLDPSVRDDVLRTLKHVKEFVHWDIRDPYMGTREGYARIRDEIEAKLKDWLEKHTS